MILWEAEGMSAIGGYYYIGLLKGTIFLYEHDEEMPFAPNFLSLEQFYNYYRRVLRDYTEDSNESDYEDKFWRDIDFN